MLMIGRIVRVVMGSRTMIVIACRTVMRMGIDRSVLISRNERDAACERIGKVRMMMCMLNLISNENVALARQQDCQRHANAGNHTSHE